MAQAKTGCIREWDQCNDPPCHPADSYWNGCSLCIDRAGIAAAIRALVDQVVPEEQLHPPFDVPVWPERAQARRDLNLAIWARQEVRTKLLAIAAELDGGAPQPTSTETTNG
jgi:hypothetical protein